MREAVIVSAVRTPVGTAFKGTLRETSAEQLAVAVLTEALRRSGFEGADVDDVILAESLAGGGVIARHSAVAAGLVHVPGQSVNRHCAGGLTAVGNAAAAIRAGMADVVVAGGSESTSMAPELSWVDSQTGTRCAGLRPTFPHADGVDDDVTINVGWNTAQEVGITREEMDRWALRSHQRAVRAIDNGVFADEIVPIQVRLGGEVVDFTTDEHPRRSTTLEKLATLAPLHPEIEGFSITAGNAAGVNDAASALVLASADAAKAKGVDVLARVLAWGAVGVEPRRTGMGAVEAIPAVLARAGLTTKDIDLWEINEAFACVPVAASRLLDLDEERINVHGSGCSLGHPIAASGGRMLATLIHELRRHGGGLGMAAMCAGGGMGGAVIVEV